MILRFCRILNRFSRASLYCVLTQGIPSTTKENVAMPQIEMILNSKSIGMDFKTELGQVLLEMKLGQKMALAG